MNARTRTRALGPRLLGLAAACLALLLSITGTAAAYYAYTDSSTAHPAQASGDSLPQGATPATPATTPNPNSSTVSISFAQASTAAGLALPAASYQLERYPSAGGAPVAVTAPCTGTGTITCTESSVPDGRWQYTDTPTAGQNWVGSESAKSPAVTVDTTPPTVGVAYPASGMTYGSNWSGSITGTASDATSGVSSVHVAIEDTTTSLWWNGTSFSANSASYQPATGTTSWTYALPSTKLTSGHSYSIAAQATDAVGNTAASPATAFTYNSSAPSAAVGYPVANVTYDGNWTGSVSGTASSNAGSATTLTGVGVAIEDTTTSQWWNGTSFSAASAAYQPATGTTSWTYALSAAALTSGHAYAVTVQATDSAGNTGTSSTIPFSYNTTHPSVAVSYPGTNTTYGSNWSGTISGSASSNAGAGTAITSAAVAIEDVGTTKWWNGTGFTATSQTFLTASGTSSWSYGLTASALTSGHSYSVIAQATDSAGNIGTSATTTFVYDTTVPSVTVSYPVANTTYGSSWAGSITGAATSNAGSGTSIASTAVAIEDTTTSQWWNGTSFSAASAAYQSATGTTNWTYALSAAALTSGHSYSVTARATDSAGNTGNSTSVSFAYSTTTSIGQATTTSPAGTLTVPNISTMSGATYLIAVYCQGFQSSCGSNNSKASVSTGAGTPFASTPAETNLASEGTGTSKDCLEVIEAIGNGTTGTVTINGNGGNVIFANVIQLATGATVHTPTASNGSTSPATANVSSAGAWIVPVAVTDGNGNTTITSPSGWSALGSPMHSTVAGADLSLFFDPSAAQGTASFTLSPSAPSQGWAEIALQVG